MDDLGLSGRLQLLRMQTCPKIELLSERTEIPLEQLKSYERGELVPNFDVIIVLSKFFRVSTDYILKGDTVCLNPEPKREGITYSCLELEDDTNLNKLLFETLKKENYSPALIQAVRTWSVINKFKLFRLITNEEELEKADIFLRTSIKALKKNKNHADN